eukprot:scaffold3446_cov393-Prasinococcus_capsulatus_cf.AAC.8
MVPECEALAAMRQVGVTGESTAGINLMLAALGVVCGAEAPTGRGRSRFRERPIQARTRADCLLSISRMAGC